jgi:hypothetical protein
VRAASGGGQLTEREPIFVPGGLLRLALYAVIAVLVGFLYPYVYGFFDFIFWGR